MMMMLPLPVLLFLGASVAVSAASSSHLLVRDARSAGEGLKRICYYISWSQYRIGDGRYTTDDVDANLCTHIVYAFASLNEVTFEVEDYEWNDGQQMASLVALKSVNPSLKITIAIGGWNAGTIRFQKMTATSTNRAIFISSLLSYMQKHSLDGFDLDWEYPEPQDKDNLSALMEELRESFGNKYLLSIAMGVGESKIKNYDLEKIHQYLDWLGLMTYDMAGAWDLKTGYHSGLYPSGTNPQLCQDWVVKEILRREVPASKIILGIPIYGRSFTHSLAAGSNPPIGTPASAGLEGPYTKEPGINAYYEICQKVVSGEYTEGHDTVAESAFAYGGNQWVGYDNKASTQVKCEYALSNGLGGTMVWDMSMDDFRNSCGGESNPIMSTIKAVLTGGAPAPGPAPTPAPGPAPSPTPAPTSAPTSPPSGGCDYVCGSSNGFFPDPCDCSKYFRCVNDIIYPHSCPEGLVWNPTYDFCDWPENVPECQ